MGGKGESSLQSLYVEPPGLPRARVFTVVRYILNLVEPAMRLHLRSPDSLSRAARLLHGACVRSWGFV